MNVPALAVCDPPEFALRIAMRPDPGAWSLLVVPAEEIVETAADLTDEVAALDDRAPVPVDVGGDSDRFINELMRFPASTLIVTGVDGFGGDGWESLDLARSRLIREGETVLVLGQQAAEDLLHFAPHLASWVNGWVWTWSAELRIAEQEPRRAERLADLHAWAPSLSDDDVIKMAQAGRLPAEPEYVEWLLLIGRGDLLGSS